MTWFEIGTGLAFSGVVLWLLNVERCITEDRQRIRRIEDNQEALADEVEAIMEELKARGLIK